MGARNLHASYLLEGVQLGESMVETDWGVLGDGKLCQENCAQVHAQRNVHARRTVHRTVHRIRTLHTSTLTHARCILAYCMGS